MKSYKINIVIFALAAVSCSGFLDEKPDISLQEPNSLDDLQALLDHENTLNGYLPSIGEIASDYYYLGDESFASRMENVRLYYVWDPDALTDNTWTFSYNQIFYHNLVLDRVDDVSVGNLTENDRKRIKGTASFMRAMVYFNLATIFAPQYMSGINGEEPSIPLKKSADINEQVKRVSLEELFLFIENDLANALRLLPEETAFKTKANQLSAKALISRFYLSLGKWEQALLYAKLALEHDPVLLDFNEINAGAAIPFLRQNEETVFYMTVSGNESVFSPSFANVDSALYRMYEESDLRKYVFFRENNERMVFKGSYTGANNSTLFGGITTAEIYLNLGECYIRTGQVEKGLSYINALLEKRYEKGKFIPYQGMEQMEALKLVKEERRKELCFKGGIRWMDLKRYTTEKNVEVLLKREVNGKNYTLNLKERPVPFKLPQTVREKYNF